MRKQGTATQFIVDGKPFVALGGEFEHDTSTSLENLRPIWPTLVKMNVNFVSPVAYWELVEPEEGKYDFTLVDGIIQEARRNHLRIGFVWFASFKNGLGVFAPLWVKKDFKRFPRAQPRGHTSMEIFSVIEGYGDATRDADARAFAALMRHIKEVDGRDHTVIMMQVENEVGVLGDSRDRSAAADKAFAGPVPKELMDYLAEAQGHAGAGIARSLGRQRVQDLGHLGSRSSVPASPTTSITDHAASEEGDPRRRGGNCTGRWMRSSWRGTMPATSTRSSRGARPSTPFRCT